jgi:hypothetical protein
MDFQKVAEDFKSASDELRRPVTLEEIARECGLSVDSLCRAMLFASSEAYLPPPMSWREDLAFLARARAAELVELADELEATAWAPATEEELEEIGSIILNRFESIKEPGGDGTLGMGEGTTPPDEPPTLIEERQEDFEKRWAEIEERRADRKKQREEESAKLNQLFLQGIKKAP